MIRLYRMTWRNWLIALHDVLATGAAVLVAFYLRFEGSRLFDRLPLLLWILPYFLLFSFVVSYLFRLTATKWRFISLPDLFNILRVSTVLAVALLVVDYIFLAPNVYGTFFLGKTTIILYWFVQIFFFSGARLAYRYFRYTRTRNQARVGLIETLGARSSKALALSEIALPSAEGRLKFGDSQDLFLRYRPQLLNTYRHNLPWAANNPGKWAGWTTLQRVLLTYRVGNEHDLEFFGQANLSAGKLDTSNPDALVAESGFLPGALGQTVSYLNASAILQLKKRLGRNVRLLSVETLGIVQYQISGGNGYFSQMPETGGANTVGEQSQLRLIAHQELEYLLNARHSLFAGLDYSDVSYQQTASFPGISPMVGYGFRGAGPTQLKIRAGFIRYWTNPFPGIWEKPGTLPVADLAVSHTFTSWRLPKLRGNALVGIAPYYNLLFSSLEPRTTVLGQLTYSVSRSFDVLSTFRFLSSRYFNGRRFVQLQHGHPRNIVMGSAGLRYHWKTYLQVDLTGYATAQTYEPSTTQGYTTLRQFYALLGLQGSWQRR
jgi:hypothetical protein